MEKLFWFKYIKKPYKKKIKFDLNEKFLIFIMHFYLNFSPSHALPLQSVAM